MSRTPNLESESMFQMVSFYLTIQINVTVLLSWCQLILSINIGIADLFNRAQCERRCLTLWKWCPHTWRANRIGQIKPNLCEILEICIQSLGRRVISRYPFNNLNGNGNCAWNGIDRNLGPTHFALITSLAASTCLIWLHLSTICPCQIWLHLSTICWVWFTTCHQTLTTIPGEVSMEVIFMF